MKKINLTFLIILIGIASIFAQPPQAFKYQAVVRDNSGEIIANQPVSIRISIIQDSITGTLKYSETHNSTTNQFGVVALNIGNGTIETGVYENISWGAASHYLKVELDETGGTNYQLMGIPKLLSVPFALNSRSLTLSSPNGGHYEVTVDDYGNLVTSCFPMPSISVAGPDQDSICVPATLGSNIPESGIGLWSIINGEGGSLSDSTNSESQFLGIAGNTYTLRWTITNVCGYTEDDMNIAFVAIPPFANAGPDQSYIVSPATLAANDPGNGTGTWTILSGTGGDIIDLNNPVSSFSGIADSSYTLRWTISALCDTTFDEVNVVFDGCPLTVTDIDGNTYNTASIDTQCWMAENLKTTTYKNGTPIPNVTDDNAWSNLTSGAYVWYNNDTLWKDPYGALYNWYAVTDPNGLCPTGWHIPDEDEWTALTDFIGGTSSPHGNMLKSCRQVNHPYGGDCNTSQHPRWNSYNYSLYGTDNYGFSGLPGGTRLNDGDFSYLGSIGDWWSATEDSSSDAWIRRLKYNKGNVGIYSSDKIRGRSVRCLKD